MKITKFLISSCVAVQFTALSQIIFPTTGSVNLTTCSGTLLDPGGLADYPANTDGNLIIYPSSLGQYASLTINSFFTESGFDYFKIYDGSAVGTNLISEYSGSITSGFISSSNPNGALAIRFRSDGDGVRSGYDFTMGCTTNYLRPTVSNYSYLYTSSSGFNLVIKSSTSWSITGVPDWMQLQTLTGFGDATVNMTATGNNLFVDRDVYLTLSGSNQSKKVYIMQEALPDLSVDNEVIFTTAAGNNTFFINSYSYNWQLASTLPSGFTISPTSGTGSSLVTVTSSINNGQNNLANGIVISYPNGSKKVQFYQLGSMSVNNVMQSMRTTTITACSGNLLSPGALAGYINNENSTITILPSQAGKNVILNFKYFKTQNTYDKLFFYDGLSVNNVEIGNNYSGYNTVFSNVSENTTTGAITLNFTSDNSTTTTGFLAEIGCINVAKVPFLGTQTITSCNSMVLDNGGVSDYLSSSNGSLVIMPSDANKSIQIKVESFRTEFGYDFLSIYDGTGTSSGINFLGSYSGSNPTIPGFISNQGPITLRFNSDNGFNYAGFKINVSCVALPPAFALASVSISGMDQLIVRSGASRYTATTFPSTATSPITVDWYLSGVAPVYNTTAVDYTPGGVIQVTTITVIAYNRVSTVTSIKIVNITNSVAGISDLFANNDSKMATIYPNPSSSQISILAKQDIAFIEIFNLQGQNMMQSVKTNIDIATLQKGVYMLKIQYKNEHSEFLKFLKE